jgi:hypothetical protein
VWIRNHGRVRIRESGRGWDEDQEGGGGKAQGNLGTSRESDQLGGCLPRGDAGEKTKSCNRVRVYCRLKTAEEERGAEYQTRADWIMKKGGGSVETRSTT